MAGPELTALAPPVAARVPTVAQRGLFDAGEPSPGRSSELRRIGLGADSWVDHAPGWLAGADRLFDELVGALSWTEGRRPMYERMVAVPRLTAWCPLDDPVVPPVLVDIAHRLGEHYGETFATVGANLYRDGRDSVAWHGDRIGRVRRSTTIPLLSLGEPRRFLLRPVGGGRSQRFDLGRGDLLVMGGACQREWQHCVPKAAAAGTRLSVTLRVAADQPGSIPDPGPMRPRESHPPPSTTSSSPFT